MGPTPFDLGSRLPVSRTAPTIAGRFIASLELALRIRIRDPSEAVALQSAMAAINLLQDDLRCVREELLTATPLAVTYSS